MAQDKVRCGIVDLGNSNISQSHLSCPTLFVATRLHASELLRINLESWKLSLLPITE